MMSSVGERRFRRFSPRLFAETSSATTTKPRRNRLHETSLGDDETNGVSGGVHRLQRARKRNDARTHREKIRDGARGGRDAEKKDETPSAFESRAPRVQTASRVETQRFRTDELMRSAWVLVCVGLAVWMGRHTRRRRVLRACFARSSRETRNRKDDPEGAKP